MYWNYSENETVELLQLFSNAMSLHVLPEIVDIKFNKEWQDDEDAVDGSFV